MQQASGALRRVGLVGALLALVSVLAVTAAQAAAGDDEAVRVAAGGGEEPTYEATITRTTYGVPHVVADDVGSVAFGAAHAFVEDNLCVIAEEMVNVRAERALTFGDSAANVASDWFHQLIIDEGRVEQLLDDPDSDFPSQTVREAITGYTAGYNHYVTEVAPKEHTDPRCAGEDWALQPIDEIDLWRYYHSLLLFASQNAIPEAIVNAQPPQAGGAGAAGTADLDEADAERILSRLGQQPLGSNAYGLGSQATEDGTGMVLGNPHFPWHGNERFYRQHLTVPGELDATGASLFGMPIVNIGHNEHVAWSHTVSTARRMVIYELELVDGDPTSYLVDGVEHQMEPVEVALELPDPDGKGTITEKRTYWITDLGPVAGLPGVLPWTEETAHVIFDPNAEQMRAPDSWLQMGQATSVDELVEALDATQGVPWVNTIAADSQGQALYADHSVVPHVTDEQYDQCLVQDLFGQATVFDGTDSDCLPGSDPDAAAEGIFAPDDLPVLIRDDYVANMNNSHWLANPNEPLEGFSPQIGSESADIGLRARLGIWQVEERLFGQDDHAGQPGVPENGFNLPTLQAVMYENRNHGAELVVDDLVDGCQQAEQGDVDADFASFQQACDVLDDWDRRVGLDSVGAHLFREMTASGGLAFTDQFQPSDPFEFEDLNQPNQLDVPAAVEALDEAVQRLDAAGVAHDAPLGELQTVTRTPVDPDTGEEGDPVTIPIHGGPGGEGIFNMIVAPFDADAGGYPEVQHGASFVLTAELTPDGPNAEAMLTYSQSTDPSSPHYFDQTEQLFSAKQWADTCFDAEASAGLPECEVISETTVAGDPYQPRTSFKDVSDDSPHKDAVELLAGRGVILGIGGGEFGPYLSITRAQTSSILARALELDLDEPAEDPFDDVPADSTHGAAIAALSAEGIIEGVEPGLFDPSGPITRAQAASMIARALELDPDQPAEDPFDDVSADATHAAAIAVLADMEVLLGTGPTTFEPGADIARAQLASVVHRAGL